MSHVASLHIYPLKSARGLSLTRLEVDAFGPKGDRRFMVVNTKGLFMTQRRHPQMALLALHHTPEGWRLSFPEHPTHSVLPPARSTIQRVTIWGEDVPGHDMGDEVATWLSGVLKEPCRLVHMHEDTLRPVDRDFSPEEAQVSFADGFPFLLISQASLDDLNARLAEHVGMERFRPNIVVAGVPAFAEDRWKRIRIGDIILDVVKPCARCVMTTVEQSTGVKGKEPMATLKTYRKFEGAVLFGQNLVHRGRGTMKVGQELEVLETQ